MKYALILTFSLFSTVIYAQTDKALADTLARMVVADQQAAGLPPTRLHYDSPEWLRFKDSVFTLQYQRLKEIFAHTGYPGYDKVGVEGSHHFWLMVQHLDKWPEFQQQVLDAMEKAVAEKNASAGDFAYLTDRVRLNTGRLQLYGTQVSYNTDSCQAFPKSLDTPALVNKRRKAAGMEPLEKYLNFISEMHFMMNKAGYEKKGIKGPKLYTVPE